MTLPISDNSKHVIMFIEYLIKKLLNRSSKPCLHPLLDILEELNLEGSLPFGRTRHWISGHCEKLKSNKIDYFKLIITSGK